MSIPHAFQMSRLSRLLPWIVLAVTLSVTWLLWKHESRTSRKEVRAQFDFALRDTVSRVEQRVAAHEQMLRGLQGLFATTGLKNRAAFRDYVETLQLDANFSGVQIIGLVDRVPGTQKKAHEAVMRGLGVVNYAVYPEGDREFYTPIIQREPQLGRNWLPPGLDIWANPDRRMAMERARDSGQAAITAKVRLAIDKKPEAQPGFIMYLPVYAHGQSRDTVAQRRSHLIGWIYAAFYVEDFMASLYGTSLPGVVLDIYDGAEPTANALMYSVGNRSELARHDGLHANEYMVVAGRTWTLSLHSLREFDERYGRNVAGLIAATGFILSLSLALLSWFMVTGRERALRLAAGMTEELRHMAQHDPLTGLPNRALFSDRLGNELARGKRNDGHFGLIFVDLDRFKPINDSFGHAVGDLLLRQVAQRMKETVRASDTVGRIGGDEFVVLMPMLADAEAARLLAEKLRQAIARPFVLDGRELTISCSLGVALYPDDGQDEITLAKSADEAMYQAKQSGRNRVWLAS